MFCIWCQDFVQIEEKDGKFYCNRCKSAILKRYLPEKTYIVEPECNT
jgi:hypothetical protein